MLTLEDWEPLQRPNLTTRRRGRRAPKGADGAHGAASGARTARGREADRRDSGDARARAPRATDRAAGAGHESAPPVPRYNFRSGANPAGVRPTGGRGERPVGAAGEGERPDAKQNGKAPPHRRPNAAHPPTQAPVGGPRARRQDAKATRQPVAQTQTGARPAAKPPRPPTRRRPAGAGATAPHHAHQRRRDHASGRRNGGEAGGDGAGRAALGRDCWPPTPCHQRRVPHRAAQAARPTQTGATSTGRRTGARPPDAANRRARHKLPLPRAQRGARPSGRATGQATGRKADGRDGAAGESGRLCASVTVFSAGGG